MVPGYSFADYRAKVTRIGAVNALEEAMGHSGHEIADHERSILATYKASRELLSREDAVDACALRLLAIASCLALNVPIDRRLLRRALTGEGESVDDEQVGLATERLLNLSLLGPSREEDSDEGNIVIHPLVAEYSRAVLDVVERDRVELAVAETMSGLLPDTSSNYWRISRPGAHSAREWLSPSREAHVVEVRARMEGRQTMSQGRSGTAIGDVGLARGNFSGAMAAYKASLAIRERLAAQDPEYAGWQRDLSVSHDRVGDVQRAQLAAARPEHSHRSGSLLTHQQQQWLPVVELALQVLPD